jgi:hypothetical protein
MRFAQNHEHPEIHMTDVWKLLFWSGVTALGLTGLLDYIYLSSAAVPLLSIVHLRFVAYLLAAVITVISGAAAIALSCRIGVYIARQGDLSARPYQAEVRALVVYVLCAAIAGTVILSTTPYAS